MWFYIETAGCTMNQHDSEIIVGLLENANHNMVADARKADAIILNTCTVKDPTEQKMRRKLREYEKLAKNGKKLIVTGCMAQIQPRVIQKEAPSYTAIVGPRTIMKFHEIMNRIEEGEEKMLVNKPEREVKVCVPKKRLKKAVTIVPIAEGCTSTCSMCIVKFARGKLRSFPEEKIIQEIKEAIAAGPTEIQLTGQDTGDYGKDRGSTLIDLLNEITALKGDFRLRIGMMNPENAYAMIDDLIDVYQDERFYSFAHIPVQSGSNDILRKMNRKYSVNQFKEVVAVLRKKIPHMTIWTDVIVGFPGETEAEFKETIELLEETNPDTTHITRFSPRPKTRAAKMPNQIPGWKKKERSRILTKKCLETSLERNRLLENMKTTIFVTHPGYKGGWIGRTFNYKPVVIEENLIGKFVDVKIMKAHETYLEAQTIT